MKQIFYTVFIFLAFGILGANSTDAVFDLVLLDDPTALCLDGTPGAYYISR